MTHLARIRQLTLGLVAGLVVVLVATALPTSSHPVHAATNCDVADYSIDGEEQAFLTLINNYRVQNGLATLGTSPSLNRASVWMAADMAAYNYFSHTDRLGRQWDQRMAQCDVARVGPGIWSENIAAWYDTAASVFDGWKNSPGHNTNMLNPNFRSIGIARVTSTLPSAGNTTPGFYWVTDFSNETPPAPPPPPAVVCGNPSISSTPSAASLLPNTTMTFTATVTGCSAPIYLWYVYDAANGWIPQGTWTANNTFSWTPRAAGSFTIAYWATQQGGTPANGFTDTAFTAARTVTAPNVCGTPGLTSAPNAATLAANTIMTFTATVSGCTTPNYVWFVWDPVNGWIAQGTWTASNTFSWTPRTPGTYQVAYWATQPGGTPANGVTDTSFSLGRTVTP
jgi:uncharacterized protein YkwD